MSRIHDKADVYPLRFDAAISAQNDGRRHFRSVWHLRTRREEAALGAPGDGPANDRTVTANTNPER